MRYVSISYALRLYLICVTFLSHMRYVSISYEIDFCTICYNFLYYIVQFSVLYATAFSTICHRNLYYMPQKSVLYAGETRTVCLKISYTCNKENKFVEFALEYATLQAKMAYFPFSFKVGHAVEQQVCAFVGKHAVG